MPRPARPSTLRVAERLYCTLLLAYPPTYRRAYGPLMLQLFRDLCRDAYRQRRAAGLVWLGGHVLVDTVVNAVFEHAEALTERTGVMTAQQHARVIVSAGMPLALAAFLFGLNPNYMKQMIMPGSAQPTGWLMTIAVFVLTGAAYIVQRRIFVQSGLSEPDSAAASKATHLGWTLKRGFALALSSLLLVLPAVLLVVLGPALLQVMKFLDK